MSTTDGTPRLVMDQAPRSTATPPVDAAVERFMETYRTSSQQDDFDFAPITGFLNALPYGIAFWLVLIVLIWWLVK